MIRFFHCLRLSAIAFVSIMILSGFCHAQRNIEGRYAQVWDFLVEKYDKNKDGKISKDEYERGDETFARLDRNGDGFLTQNDWDGVRGRRPRQRPGDRLVGIAPEEGEVAPDFNLPYVKEPEQRVRLSSFAEKKPVALIFGSYT